MGRDEPEPVVRDGANPRIRGARPAGRRAATPPRSPRGSATSGSAPTPAARSVCRPHAAASSGSSPAGAASRRTASFRSARLRHGRPDGDERRGRRADVVGAHRRAGARAAAARADGRAADAAAVGRRSRAAENRAAEQYVARLEALGARVVEASIPEPPDDTWPLFFHEAAESHRATFPARADEYGDNVRAKLEHAQTIDPDDVDARASRCGAGASTGREVDLYVAPTLGVEIPPEDCDELEVRIPVTAFLRPFNVLGWAGARDRRPAARRAAGRGRARRGPRLGERRTARRYGVMSWILSRGRQRQVDLRAEVGEAAVDDDVRRPRCVGSRRARGGPAPRRRARSLRGTASRDSRCRRCAQCACGPGRRLRNDARGIDAPAEMRPAARPSLSTPSAARRTPSARYATTRTWASSSGDSCGCTRGTRRVSSFVHGLTLESFNAASTFAFV